LNKHLFLLLALFVSAMPLLAQSNAAERAARDLTQGALADFDARRYDAALEKLLEVEKKFPGNPANLNLLGAAYTKKKDYAKAQTYFEETLAKEPKFFPALFNIGELLFLQRRYAESAAYFENMLNADPRNELLQFKVFLSQLQVGETEKAKKSLDRIKYPSDTPAWYYAQAAWESKRGDNKKAREYLTGARYIFGPKTALFDETFEDLGIKLR